MLAGHVQAAFGGDFLSAFGHEHGLVGLDATGDVNHFVGGGHFEVEFDLTDRFEPLNIVVLDVAAVFAEMDGDAVGATQLCLNRGPNRVGFVGAAGLAYRGDVVDIDTQFDHDLEA